MMTDDISIRLITYNVADEPPPSDLTELLNLKPKGLANIYAIGLQELNSTSAQLASDALYNDPWTNAITKAMVARNYLRVKAIRLLGIHLSIYVRKPDLIYVNNVEASYTRTGFGGYWGNKGGVSIRLDICGVNMCVVNCHLDAHLPAVANRLASYAQIIESQTFQDVPTILDHDYVFFMGDLNFRLDDVPKKEVEKQVEKREYASLLKNDQLKKCMQDGLCLVGFHEEEITFPCSFKFDKNTSTYDTSKKQRKPGYCDRILWKCHKASLEGTELGVTPRLYTSLQNYCGSDHKPVVAEFNFRVLRCPLVLPVMFEPLDVWVSSTPGKCVYTISTNSYSLSTWDWVGLYKSTYQHENDYVTWVYVSQKGEDMGDGTTMYELVIDEPFLREQCGMYYLCYYSAQKRCFVGYSDLFKISLTEDSSSSDESMAIGAVGGAGLDEDDDDDFDAAEGRYGEEWDETERKNWEIPIADIEDVKCEEKGDLAAQLKEAIKEDTDS